MQQKVGAVLVVGAGVGGIRAALDLAESGFRVYLIDNRPSIGGTLSQLDHWFPDNQCEMCKILPVFYRDECSQFCLFRDLAHPNVELIPNAEIEKVKGKAGNFEVSLNIKSRWVIAERCTGCGLCVGVCPIEVRDEFNEGLKNRKAIYVRNPIAIPNVYAIDRDNCNRCGKCVKVCPTQAIDLSQPDELQKLAVGAIIVSTGFEEFDPLELGQYGFGRYPNVLTSIQLERMLGPSGPLGGKLVRPSDGKAPRQIAFLQCVGSRDIKRNYCSTACCMYALKEAIRIKEQNPKAGVNIFYMDLRAFGKGYYRYYQQAKDDFGIKFTRCRVPLVRQNPKTKNLLVLARAEDGSLISSEFDLVVLSNGQCPSPRTAELAHALGIRVNKWGFLESQDSVKTAKKGIYVCGSAVAPADIAETVTQCSAAASQASILLSSARNQLVSKKVYPKELDLRGEEPKVAIFICRCGEEIASVVDMEQVVAFAKTLPDVVHVEDIPYLCLPETLAKVKQTIAESGANRVIFAACAPYHYKRLFEDAIRQVRLDPSLWHLVNFREQISWVHKDDKAQATGKGQHMLAIALEQLRGQEPLPVPSASAVNHQALVIGGGISGLSAAPCLAEQGFEVHLVERTAELGGHAKDWHYSLGNENPKALVNSLCQKVTDNPLIHLHLETEVLETTGHAGNFRTTIKTGESKPTTIEHGAVIIATGAEYYQPTEYMYGQDDRIITQKELQKRLAAGSLNQTSTVVMIQCVGFRDSDRPYCSRTCCSDAIANALKIKEQSPETQVFILYRDIMTYGFKEEYYTRAREAGVLFVRYELDRKPMVNIRDKVITVRVVDPILQGRLQIEADLLVLSTGIVPRDNQKLAQVFSLELTEDGFFKEVDTKFRPVDALIDGVFICGLAHSPRSIDEEIAQAQAAAQRAAAVLARERLESGRIVSEVNARRCSGCELCVTICPYAARKMDEERKVAVVTEALCQGCGVCVALCPNAAAKLRGLKEKQVFSMIEAAL